MLQLGLKIDNLFFSLSTAVDFVCDHPDIRAISFVGSDRVGKYIYERGSSNGKRVQPNMVCMYTHIYHTMSSPSN